MTKFFFLMMAIVFSACGKHAHRNNSAEEVQQDKLYTKWRNTATPALTVLNQYIPKLKGLTKNDTIYPFDKFIEEDTSRVMIIGKFIDGRKTYALDLLSKDTIINFYSFDGQKWNKAGSGIVGDYTFSIIFRDLDGDNRNEIVTSTFGNMNGNRWMKIFYASPDKDSIHPAGSFSTLFYVDKANKTIETFYEGSWYMDREQTLYRWYNEQLLPVRSVVRGLKKKDMKHNAVYIEYYENPTINKDTLVMKFHKTYHDRNLKLYHLWEDFFTTDTLHLYDFEN